MRNFRSKAIGLVMAALVSGLVFSAAPALANEDDIIKRGNCSSGADWKLKLSPEDGKIEVEFEVDSNVNGQTWNVVLKHDGERFFKGQKVTKGPSGSFEVRKVTGNNAGADHIVGKARNINSDETCKGSASF